MFGWFEAIAVLLSNVVTFFVNTIKMLVFIIVQIPKAISFLLLASSYLPPFLVPFILAFVALSILVTILNLGGN